MLTPTQRLLAPEALIDDIKARYEQCCPSASEHEWKTFEARLNAFYQPAVKAFFSVYGLSDETRTRFSRILTMVMERWAERSPELKALDAARQDCPDWFNSHRMFGATCYVDRFAGSLKGLIDKVPYLAELGVSYLYLMPFFKTLAGDNDGGFAISSYREVDPRFGSMDDLLVLTERLRQNGISLVVDFVLNHTSDEHEWALKAIQGDAEYQAYYHTFDHGQSELIAEYNRTASNPFPDQGEVLQYHPAMQKWVWSGFYRYQWDLNYHNPAVFQAMLDNALFLLNQGVEVLRLDAVPFIWKRPGTSCVAQPECLMIVEAFKALIGIAAPSAKFKSEAMMEPTQVLNFVAKSKCDISYRPTLNALLWESLATSNAEFLAYCTKKWFRLPDNCTWINYVNHHDDISWCFSDQDFSVFRFGMNPHAMRQRLQAFYTGYEHGSFARGVPFQFDPVTGICRISGTTASLAGMEKAVYERNQAQIKLAIRRINLLHGVLLSVGGLPMIFLGDELGVLNDYSYQQDPQRSADSRWVHRPVKDWELDERIRSRPETPGYRIFEFLTRAVRVRKSLPEFAGCKVRVISSSSPSVFAYLRSDGLQKTLVLANFSMFPEEIDERLLKETGASDRVRDCLSGAVHPVDDFVLPGYGIVWLKADGGDVLGDSAANPPLKNH